MKSQVNLSQSHSDCVDNVDMTNVDNVDMTNVDNEDMTKM